MESWTSPDGKIEKQVLIPGKFDTKPYDNSECTINIVDCPDILAKYNNVKLVIGDIDGDVGRLLDLGICTMHLNERSKFTFVDLNITFVCELDQLRFNGFIYEWNASIKYKLALMHKEKGISLFKENNYCDAAYRFSKGLKLILLIPIDVQSKPKEIDGVPLEEIQNLKANLYNNLSSCYLKKNLHLNVIDLCKKVFLFDPNNVKALYKIGIAYETDKNYDKAYEALLKATKLDPNNKACAEHLMNVKLRLKESDARMSDLMKKMFTS